MGKLRHIAIQVPDLEKAAAFYEGVFGLKRLSTPCPDPSVRPSQGEAEPAVATE